MQLTALASRPGSTPMSFKRSIALAALCAWTVVRTRWPVMPACIAIRAVSSSRISPTSKTSGSERRIVRSPRAKEAPLGRDLDVVDPADLVLDRVLDGHDHVARVVQQVQRGVERRRLARAHRPAHDDRAVGLANRLLEVLTRERGHPELAEIGLRDGAVHDPEHDLLAVRRRHDRDAQVERVALEADRDAAVLGRTPLGDVEVPMIFRRLITPSCICFGIWATGRVTPSMRARTIMSSSCGSKWMSTRRPRSPGRASPARA